MLTQNNQDGNHTPTQDAVNEVSHEITDIYVKFFNIDSPEGIFEYVYSILNGVASELHKEGIEPIKFKQFLYTHAIDIKIGGTVFVIDVASKMLRLKDIDIDISGASPNLLAYPDKNYLGKIIQIAGTTGVSLILGAFVPGGIIGTVVGGAAINSALNAIWGNLIGPHVMSVDYKASDNAPVKERKYITIEGTFKQLIEHNWKNYIGKDIAILDRVIIQASDTNGNYRYFKTYEINGIKTDEVNTYEIPTESEEHLIEFLKRFEKADYTAHIKLGSKKNRKLVVNYFANFGEGAKEIISDLEKSDKKKAASYCLQYLEGYALEGHRDATEYKERTKYSEQHIQDRAKFFSLVVSERIGNSPSGDEYFTEVKNGKVMKSAGNELNRSGDMANTEVVFVDGENPSMELSAVDRRVYGYDRDDTIVYKYGNNYIESGLGSDTIITGKGSDTIYTNANIDVKYDQEDNNVQNTVHAGAGNDTIYGSKGMDEIYGEDDNDTIYGGGGDDKIYGGEGNDTLYADDVARGSIDTSSNINKLYGGAGNDTLVGGEGTDHLYAGNEKINIFTDSSTTDDTLDGKGGNDFLYGSNGHSNMKGGAGNDTFYSGEGMDKMQDDEGDDTYYVGHRDTIDDSDGIGKVFFNNFRLFGGKYDEKRGIYVDKNDSNVTYILHEETN